ncbi:MAG: alanine--tRNA ligase [Archangiaceae bacterium]|nr:alanine--tRNA ligase [Archangiaceae bacterium]
MSSSLSADQIRERFLSFFAERGHKRVASSSLVPANDPTLLFTNAGMVQFKDVFTGREKRDYSRAATSQKCVRAGGKHNDLDNVGFTARHHTFFEMLGNFSFGDYFKPDAVKWGWELVTQGFGLDPNRLAVTVFKGEDGIPADEEAAELWVKAGVPRDRVFRLGLKDNFWSMGDTGPCGPCSEIYYYVAGPTPDPKEVVGESDKWVEIWNLVFMQFERKVAGGKLEPLPKPSIDTGAGLERVCAAIQGKQSNYDTDLFTPLLAKVAQLCGKKYGGSPTDASMRVIADHSRAAAFLIGDGVMPSNEGRGYVLRRIMRRAIRHGHQMLGMREPFMHESVSAVIELMSAAYPELRENQKFILEATRHEEQSFRRTLENGLKLIDDELGRMKKAGEKTLKGETVWFLHDTHGMPPDVTKIILQEHGFDAEDPKKPERADADFVNTAEKALSELWLKQPETKFLGYDTLTASGKVIAVDGSDFATDQSPFYGESGGQVGDTGTANGLKVVDTKKQGGVIIHRLESGAVKVGDTVELKVDGERRDRIRANHSATHLLHKALKVVLGEEVKQKGSVVAPEYLRFDFSCFKQPTPEQLETIEDLVNGWIRQNQGADTKVMGIDDARKSGAVALFGEKYGEKVRVVSVHPESTELCGGTHVKASGDIGLLKITSESSIASGVRRISAVTGHGAMAWVRELQHELDHAAAALKAPRSEITRRIEGAQKRIKELEKKLEELQLKGSSVKGGGDGENVREVNGIKVLTQQMDSADAGLMRKLADKYRDQLKSGVVGLGGTTADGKALVLVAATKDLVEKGLKAGDLVKAIAVDIGGSGGGKPDMAQAGGPDPSKIPQALQHLYELVKV